MNDIRPALQIAARLQAARGMLPQMCVRVDEARHGNKAGGIADVRTRRRRPALPGIDDGIAGDDNLTVTYNLPLFHINDVDMIENQIGGM